MPDGREITAYELSNLRGLSVIVLNYGGILQSIKTPDRNGIFKDIILGFDDATGYLQDQTCQGAVVGRFANRIAGGSYKLNGRDIVLSKNEADSCLHGGRTGFNRALWDAQIVELDGQEMLRLEHVSPNGDQGFPGELKAGIDFDLNDEDELKISITATTDADTVVNLTVHPYFNLSGDFDNKVLKHVLSINSSKYLPVLSSMVPSGEIQQVVDTAFDFSAAQTIGKMLESEDEQLNMCSGYDHYFIKNPNQTNHSVSAELFDPASGRKLRIHSDSPGIQFYTGNHLTENIVGKGGKNFHQYAGLCLEPQAYPNAPNQDNFPSTQLRPGEIYRHHIVLQFSTDS